MSNRAWVTLATNDSYGLGALVLAHSLRRAGSAYPAVVLITPSVTQAMRDRLGAVFAEVVTVDVLDSLDAAHLALLQRPELGITFTKIHCWNLTQYEKCVFLDADTLIIQNCDELFEREELSAAPDVGWPDCFNSGVFVFKPSAETFASLIQFAQERGSFDGGDQGLLNSYFSDWAHGDINKHLPFLYNVTSAAFYSYLPALKHYGQNLKIIHFIGAAKPWLQHFNWETRTADAAEHLRQFLQLWWDIFIAHVHSVLDTSMVDIEEGSSVLAPQETFHTEPRLDYGHYEPVLDPESEFPWHHPDAQIPDAELNAPEIDMTQIHDPWDIYKGHIPPNIDDSSSCHKESEKTEDQEEMRKYAWDYMSPQHPQNTWQHEHSQQHQHMHSEYYQTPQHAQHIDHSHHEFKDNLWDYNLQHSYDQNQQNIYQPPSISQPDFEHNQGDKNQQNYPEHSTQNFSQDLSNKSQHDSVPHFNQTHNLPHEQTDNNYSIHFQKDSEETHFPSHIQPQQNIDQVYCVHLDHEKHRESSHHFIDDNETEIRSKINGHGEADSEIFENITPRHPYDGFYLRHRMTIDSRGRKICTHEIPPTPSPTPPESLTSIIEENSLETPEPEEEITSYPPCDIEDQTGVAGNFARVVLGAGAQRDALDDLTRRQGWEAGNIDYMGADAFDNIWAKISQTLSQPLSSPPKQESPPREQAPAAPAAKVQAAASVPAPAEAKPVPTEALATAKVPGPAKAAPAEAAKPKSPAPGKTSAGAKTPDLGKTPTSIDPDEIAPVSAEATKVVASAPTEEPKPAAPAEAPVVEPPVVEPPVVEPPVVEPPVVEPPVVEAPVVESPAAAEPAAPVNPDPVPSETSEVLEKPEETVPAPDTAVTPSKPVVPIPEATPEKATTTTDSPPLANTPSKEEVPIVPSGKSEERRKPAGKLQLHPPAAADPLPTPDSELEDAATLAQSIIASELRTPTVTSPSPPVVPAAPAAPVTPRAPLQDQRLSVEEPELPTPPAGASAVSLSQIGVKPAKGKISTAAQIESSVSESAATSAEPAEAPKKKVVKKVLKKDGASSGEAPVPPPRKKEKKPKDK